MERKADVAVIGGGIVGCAAAYYLAKQGLRPVVFEKGRIAGEQSSRNWGFVRQQGRDPAEVPLMMASNRIWRGLEEELDADLEWTQSGNLVVAETQEKLGLFEQWLEVAKTHQLDSRLLTRVEIERLIPGIKTDALGALYTPSDGHAEPAKVAPAIARAAERLGAAIHTDCAVLAIEVNGGAVSGVVTEKGIFSADAVICASGAWTSRLLSRLGVSLPQLWMRGTVARTTAVPKEVTKMGVWAGLAFRQRRDGTFNIAAGGSADHDIMFDSLRHGPAFLDAFRRNRAFLKLNVTGRLFEHLPGRFSQGAFEAELKRNRALDPPANPRLVADALRRLRETFPDLGRIAVERSWAGYIDFTPDMIPVIDRLDRPRGLVIAAGLSGHGFGMGPIVGRLAAELAQGSRASLDVAAFRLARFSDGSHIEARNVI
ncbi:MAG: NAD(P)/FAD-dependent oxidoreductase [Alphaproteobacteria bacterium]